MTRSRNATIILLIAVILFSGLVPILPSSQSPANKVSLEQEKPQIPLSPEKNDTGLTKRTKEKRNSFVNPKYVSEDKLSPQELANRVVVKLSPGIDPEQVAKTVNAEIVRIGPLQFVTLALPAGQIETAKNQLRKIPGVLNVQPVRKYRKTTLKRKDALLLCIATGEPLDCRQGSDPNGDHGFPSRVSQRN